MHTPARWGLVLAVSMAGTSTTADVAPFPATYQFAGATVTAIGAFGETANWGNDVNTAGCVVGAYGVADASGFVGDKRAFYWCNGNTVDLQWAAPLVATEAVGVNASNEVVGTGQSAQPSSGGLFRAFYWKPGSPLVVLDENPARDGSLDWEAFGRAINDAGVIVGDVLPLVQPGQPPPLGEACRGTVPVRWSSPAAKPQVPFCPPADSIHVSVADLNGPGTIVANLGQQMLRFRAGVLEEIPRPPAPDGYAWGPTGRVLAVNAGDRVVGNHDYIWVAPGSTDIHDLVRAYYWDGVSAAPELIDGAAHVRSSSANDINVQDMVAGSAGKRSSLGVAYSAAFIWHRHFGTRTLPPLQGGGLALTPASCAALGLSNLTRDGIVHVTGYCETNGRKRAVRWQVSIDTVTFQGPSPRGP